MVLHSLLRYGRTFSMLTCVCEIELVRGSKRFFLFAYAMATSFVITSSDVVYIVGIVVVLTHCSCTTGCHRIGDSLENHIFCVSVSGSLLHDDSRFFSLSSNE